jgi:hypothetical protein
VVSFKLWPLCPQGKSAWYPLDRRLGGPQSSSGRGGEEINFQPPPGLEPPDHPARAKVLFLLFVLWTLCNVCILYVEMFVLSLQYFEKSTCLRFRRVVSVFFVLLLLHLSVCSVSL